MSLLDLAKAHHAKRQYVQLPKLNSTQQVRKKMNAVTGVQSIAESKAIKGAKAWLAIHSYPFIHWYNWCPEKAASWYSTWFREQVPSYGCSCSSKWIAYTQKHPPQFQSAQDFFCWSVEGHNHVSTTHAEPRKPPMTLEDATALYVEFKPLDKSSSLS